MGTKVEQCETVNALENKQFFPYKIHGTFFPAGF